MRGAPGARRIPRLPRPSRVLAYLSARFGPPTLEPETVLAVLAQFGLGPSGGTRDLRLGRRSLNAMVDTPRGRKVVKRYRPQWTAPIVECGHSILRRLEEVGFPAVRLERTPQGATWTTDGTNVFAVFDFVAGTNYSLSYLRRTDRMHLTRVAGDTLARFHVALAGFVPAGDHHLGFATMDGPRKRDADWNERKVGELAERSTALADPHVRGLTDELTRRAPGVLHELRALEAELESADLPRCVVHGDYGLHNLVFRHGVAVPVDFESARLDWRVNDLVSVLGKYRYRAGYYDFESMRAFMRAYGATLPLADAERELFPAAWRLYKLQAAVQYWNSYFETDGPARKLEAALDAIDQARWVARNPQPVAELAALATDSDERPAGFLRRRRLYTERLR
ncbi:MAG: hypothetical protein KatS3mg009_1901 [Acidimicrobiia bacterium]|nr:MAG: hypothetical protein KatS3mg009_1901 [Acidimicrobiia bacterium]